MWDRLRTATSATATPASAAATTTTTTNNALSTADDFLHHSPRRHPPPPTSSKPRRGASVSKHKQKIPRIRSPRSRRPDSLDDPLNALGISRNVPYKLEVRRGKVVPRLSSVDVVLPSQQQDLLAASIHVPPPRDPRRRHHQHHEAQVDSRWRPTSSVYGDSDDTLSDIDPTAPVKQASRDMYGRPAAEEQVSPPSSPEPGAPYDGRTAEDVSPIDEELDRFQQQLLGGPPRHRLQPHAAPQLRSNIPISQNTHNLPLGAPGPPVPQLRHPVPEPRSWSRQIHPGQRPAAQPDPIPQERTVEPLNVPQAYGSTTVITAPASGRRNTPSPSFGQRMRFIGRSKPEPLDNRPPWHGASGRTKLIKPVRDDPKAAPLHIPRKSSKRTGRGGVAGGPTPGGQVTSETSNAGAATASARKPRPLLANEESYRKATGPSWHTQAPHQSDAGAHSYPSPPDTDYLSQSPPAAAFQSWDHSTTPYMIQPDAHSTKPIKRKPPPGASSAFSGPVLSQGIAASAGHSSDQDAWVQPPSRFSVTTYATSNPGTPRQSVDEPPVPALPPLATSVMDRRRPAAGEHDDEVTPEPVMITMSSPYSSSTRDSAHEHGAHARIASESQQSDRRSSVLSMAKPLPPAPHEQSSSNDRVANLNAQIQGLVHRRINITRSIKQMTELMPADNLLASQEVLRKREVEKQKVDALKGELAEVQREEYELGLKLHRAYKRLDQDAEFEPTTLWVRRVTG